MTERMYPFIFHVLMVKFVLISTKFHFKIAHTTPSEQFKSKNEKENIEKEAKSENNNSIRHDCSLVWLGACTSIGGGAKIALWT